MRPDIPPDKFAEWLKQLPEETLRHGNKQEHNQAEKDYKKFVEFFTKGNCSMCKTRIEKASGTLDGVITADWDANSKMLHLEYDPDKVSVMEIEKVIAAVGHDRKEE